MEPPRPPKRHAGEQLDRPAPKRVKKPVQGAPDDEAHEDPMDIVGDNNQDEDGEAQSDEDQRDENQGEEGASDARRNLPPTPEPERLAARIEVRNRVRAERAKADKDAIAEAEARKPPTKKQIAADKLKAKSLDFFKEKGKIQVYRQIVVKDATLYKVRYTIQNVPTTADGEEVQHRLRSRELVLDDSPPIPSTFSEQRVRYVVWEEVSHRGVEARTWTISNSTFFAGSAPDLKDALSIVVLRSLTEDQSSVMVTMFNYPTRGPPNEDDRKRMVDLDKEHSDKMVERATHVGQQFVNPPGEAQDIKGGLRSLTWMVRLAPEESLQDTYERQNMSVNQLIGAKAWTPTTLWCNTT